MAVPSCDLGDFLLAYWADSVLLLPEMDKPVFPFQGVYYVSVEPFFIVGFPFRVVGVCLTFDLSMSFDRHTGCVCEVIFLPILLSIEDPVVPFVGLEVFLRDPLVGFVWVSSFHPPSESSVDRVVYGTKHVCTYYILMILCPTSNDRVEHENESSRRQRLVLLDDFPDLFQVGMHVLLCWFDQQFVLLSCFVFAYVLTEEIEPVLNMGDAGFLSGEF